MLNHSIRPLFSREGFPVRRVRANHLGQRASQFSERINISSYLCDIANGHITEAGNGNVARIGQGFSRSRESRTTHKRCQKTEIDGELRRIQSTRLRRDREFAGVDPTQVAREISRGKWIPVVGRHSEPAREE